jgi:hypothetical protein
VLPNALDPIVFHVLVANLAHFPSFFSVSIFLRVFQINVVSLKFLKEVQKDCIETIEDPCNLFLFEKLYQLRCKGVVEFYQMSNEFKVRLQTFFRNLLGMVHVFELSKLSVDDELLFLDAREKIFFLLFFHLL